MFKSNYWNLLPLVILCYIALGDTLLPPSLGNYSRMTRESINGYLMGLFPDTEIESPYGRNDEVIEEVERNNRK